MVPHQFSDKTCARLYRSGDLAQFSARGELEYLGRLDHQVKIRGFRIELGEIESVLNRHPAVRESIVLLHESTTGEKQLVAYVIPVKVCKADIPVGSQQAEPTLSDLRTHLGHTIPDYRIPATFVFLQSLL